jgi:hypothetical protein
VSISTNRHYYQYTTLESRKPELENAVVVDSNKYFNVLQLPERVGKGQHFFYIAGSQFLIPHTTVYVEILNPDLTPVYLQVEDAADLSLGTKVLFSLSRHEYGSPASTATTIKDSDISGRYTVNIYGLRESDNAWIKYTTYFQVDLIAPNPVRNLKATTINSTTSLTWDYRANTDDNIPLPEMTVNDYWTANQKDLQQFNVYARRDLGNHIPEAVGISTSEDAIVLWQDNNSEVAVTGDTYHLNMKCSNVVANNYDIDSFRISIHWSSPTIRVLETHEKLIDGWTIDSIAKTTKNVITITGIRTSGSEPCITDGNLFKFICDLQAKAVGVHSIVRGDTWFKQGDTEIDFVTIDGSGRGVTDTREYSVQYGVKDVGVLGAGDIFFIPIMIGDTENTLGTGIGLNSFNLGLTYDNTRVQPLYPYYRSNSTIIDDLNDWSITSSYAGAASTGISLMGSLTGATGIATGYGVLLEAKFKALSDVRSGVSTDINLSTVEFAAENCTLFPVAIAETVPMSIDTAASLSIEMGMLDPGDWSVVYYDSNFNTNRTATAQLVGVHKAIDRDYTNTTLNSFEYKVPKKYSDSRYAANGVHFWVVAEDSLGNAFVNKYASSFGTQHGIHTVAYPVGEVVGQTFGNMLLNPEFVGFNADSIDISCWGVGTGAIKTGTGISSRDDVGLDQSLMTDNTFYEEGEY